MPILESLIALAQKHAASPAVVAELMKAAHELGKSQALTETLQHFEATYSTDYDYGCDA